jgi:hypothetical protein
MRRILTWILWILLIVALAAVVYFVWTQFFGGDDEEAVGTIVVLECSSECSERGQCGRTQDAPQVEVVLGGLDGPIVEPQQHDRFIVAGATVEIKETRSEKMEQANGRQFDQQFSRVEFRNTMGDIQKTGWFADWCIRYP